MTRSSIARPCTFTPCGRTTTDPSSRCHDHRAAGSRGVTSAVTVPNPAPVHTEPDSDETVVTETPQGTETAYRDSAGRLHRLDGPALVVRNEEGEVSREEWYLEGRKHRSDGPALTSFDDDSVSLECYYVDGERSRIDGPAVVTYDEDGEVDESDFILAGEWSRGGVAGFRSTPEKVGIPAVTEAIRCSPLSVLLDEGRGTEEIVNVVAEGVFTLEGVRAVLDGSPVEWARSFEENLDR